mgnify:FL=1
MNDLLVNFIGAAVFSFLGYFYVKNRGKGRFTRNFIPQVLSHRAHSEEASDTAVSQEETRRISPILLPGRNKPPRSRTY